MTLLQQLTFPAEKELLQQLAVDAQKYQAELCEGSCNVRRPR